MASLDLVAGLTARLASAVSLDQVVDAAVIDVATLGFGSLWLAVLDDKTGELSTLKAMVDGVETSHPRPASVHDARQPIGRGFVERRMINVPDPSALYILEHDTDPAPPDQLAMPRAALNRMGGRPFACGPLFGSGGEPVGALGLSSYCGAQAIPDAVLSEGPMRVLIEHLGIAIERARYVARLDDSLGKAQAIIARDARLKAVGEIAVAVAHDLNNLSGIALLAVGVGLRSPAEAFTVLPRIERANRAIGDLVARLQRIARPPSSEVDAANLHEIVQDILIMLKPILRERSIDLDVEIATVPSVRCDAVLIHQVVLNLLVNAQDALAEVAADRRRIRLQVRGDGSSVRLTVADTGPGIAPEMLGKMFQPFATTKGGGHLGLGLSAAHAQLQQYGGRLEAHNAPEGGAVFEMTLLAAPPGTPARALAADQPSAAPHTTDSPWRAKILAVDDDPDVVYIIRAYLEPLGYQVATATAPAQALDAVTSQAFDLVLCDIGMPGQSGLDMSRALKQRGYGGKLVLMTGWDSHALRADPRIAEADTLIKKPFLGTELIDAIGSLLSA